MDNKVKNILIGTVAAILCAAIIIFAIEEKKSFYHILAGFMIFLFPFTFLSSFGSKIGAFVLVFVSVMAGYIVSKLIFHDFWLGVLLAGIIGGSAFYYRTNPYKPFSPSEYKKKAEEEREKRKT